METTIYFCPGFFHFFLVLDEYSMVVLLFFFGSMDDIVTKQTTSPSSFSEQPHPTSPIREECQLESSLLGEETKVRLLKKEKINFIEYNRGYIDYARENRKKPTRAENIFWYNVKERKFLWYKFKRQKCIWPFILDFYCSELLLWIELDGWYHTNTIDYDRYRDAEIYKKGILVIRFRNEDIENNLQWIFDELTKIIQELEI